MVLQQKSVLLTWPENSVQAASTCMHQPYSAMQDWPGGCALSLSSAHNWMLYAIATKQFLLPGLLNSIVISSVVV